MVEEFEIKLATIKDMKAVFDLSNDKQVRANSFNTAKIEWKSHKNWFKNKLEDENCIFYILIFQNEFLGYIRLDKENEEWIITIHLSPKFRGKGMGTKALKKVCDINKNKKIIAFVKEKNQSSYKSFSNAGFKIVESFDRNNEKVYKLEN